MSFMSLPNEMIEKILQGLDDVNELLKCREVNKRCKQIVDKMRITGSLSVENSRLPVDEYLRFDFQRYKFTDELISPMSTLFRTSNFNLVKCKFMLKMISRVRMLAIDHLQIRTTPQLNQFQSTINQLRSLEHLQIGRLTMSRTRTLRLDHIRKFALLQNHSMSLVLTAPKMTHLAALCNLSYGLQITDADQLTHLAIPSHFTNFLDQCPTEKIEYLQINGSVDQSIVHSIIRGYPALRELHVKLVNKAAVREILKQKRVARNLNLAIHFSGFRIDDEGDVEQMFGEHHELKSAPFAFIGANFDRIRLVDEIRNVNYSKLIRAIGQSALTIDEFFSKFIRIETVTVKRYVNGQANLIEFLKKCKLLTKLTISNSPLNQAFYNKLHTHCPELETLKIEAPSKYKLNLDFLFENVKLKTLSINREIEFAILSGLLQRSRTFSVEFVLKNKLVCLNQTYSNWSLNFDGYTLQYYTYNQPPNAALKALFDLIMA